MYFYICLFLYLNASLHCTYTSTHTYTHTRARVHTHFPYCFLHLSTQQNLVLGDSKLSHLDFFDLDQKKKSEKMQSNGDGFCYENHTKMRFRDTYYTKIKQVNIRQATCLNRWNINRTLSNRFFFLRFRPGLKLGEETPCHLKWL